MRVALALRHMPVTAQAFAQGELSEPRVRLLVEARGGRSRSVLRDERLLVSQARSLSARAFPKALAHWHRLADPDGALSDAGKGFERRRLSVSVTWENMTRLDGDLDPESGQVVLSAINSLAEPWALCAVTPAARSSAGPMPWWRSAAVISTPPIGPAGGERPHLVLTLSPADLAGDGLVDLDTGPINAEAARRLTCDGNLTPVVLDGRRQPGRRRPAHPGGVTGAAPGPRGAR